MFADSNEGSMPKYFGSSGFGSGEKYKVVGHYGFDWDRGRRGHDDTGKHKKSFAGRKQRHGRKRCTRIVDDYIEANWLWANYWNPSFANFRGDMEFDKRADEARYYAALMSHISPELRDDWADYDSPNWETARLYKLLDEIEDEQRAIELFLHIVYGHPDDYRGQPLYPDYGDYDMSSYPNDMDWPEEAVASKTDDDDFDMYIPTVEEVEAMIAWQETEDERLLETLQIDHSGGHRGVKARLAANRNQTRPHHFLEVA